MTSSQATSRTLLEGVRAQDREAWDRLVELYAPLVLYHCRNARLSDADAADIFQDVFQATFAKIGSFEQRASGGTFRGWLSTIARNKVRDHFRRLEREPRGVGGTEIQLRMAQERAPEAPDSTDEEAELAPDKSAESLVLTAALESIRDQFQPRTWQAFLGTAVDGRTPKDVGEELGMSVGAVRVAKSRVLARLRATLGD